jgi:hypothetical protein
MRPPGRFEAELSIGAIDFHGQEMLVHRSLDFPPHGLFQGRLVGIERTDGFPTETGYFRDGHLMHRHFHPVEFEQQNDADDRHAEQ